MRNTLEISGILLAVLLAAMAFHAWLTEHDDRLRLQATISTQKQALGAADVREHDRAATLQDTLAQIDALKRQTQTPAQVLRDLPKFLSLPQPITLNSPQSATPAIQQGTVQAKITPCVVKKGCPSPTHSAAASPTDATPAPESPALTEPTDQQNLPRRSLRANPRSREAKCHRQCHEIDRPRARTRRCRRHRQGRNILAAFASQRALVRRRRRRWSSRAVRHRPLWLKPAGDGQLLRLLQRHPIRLERYKLPPIL